MRLPSSDSHEATIFALASPMGRGGVAVVRVSGAKAHASLTALNPSALPPARQAVLRRLTHPATKMLIDQALVLCFSGPASFTGEDVIEYHLHGGRAVVDSLLDALTALPGLRLAEPGEFTRRAFENGKMDLTSAEAVADLIDAQTEAQKNQALAQMEGGLATLYDGWRHRLTRLLAYAEADIDFPDEDLPGGIAEQIRPALTVLQQEISAHLDDNRRGEILRDGVHVAVIGAPNAGKSSLVNALARREVAIVSPLAGTTRDVIETHLDLGGYPVILSDTAGLRPDQLSGNDNRNGAATASHDAIEAEGIRRARQRADAADIRILLFDATSKPDRDTLALINAASLVVLNKCDQAKPHPNTYFPANDSSETPLLISASTGEGLASLTAALVEKIKDLLGTRSAPAPTRRRHRDALEHTQGALVRAMAGVESELIAEDIRLAVRYLGRITGRVDVEDLLDVIFRDFCIGK